MDEATRAALLNLLVLILSGGVGFIVVRLELRNSRDKLKVEREQAKLEAQDIVNAEFVKINTKFDEEREQRRQESIQWAEERGGLKQQIEHLQQQLNHERELRERSGTENAERIGALSRDLEQMRAQYTQLNERLTEVQRERDTTNQELQIKVGELEVLKVEFNTRIAALTRTIDDLERRKTEQDDEISRLRLELDGRPEPIAPIGAPDNKEGET